jgi:hypothetical protein
LIIVGVVLLLVWMKHVRHLRGLMTPAADRAIGTSPL